jgi:glycosyltransferase involved in cell wall biosynthesis
MKIVYIIHGTYNSAGMERVLSIKVNYLAEIENHEIFIITTDQRNRPPFYQLSSRIKNFDLSINFDEYYQKPIIPRIFSFMYKQNICRKKISKLLIELKSDITISLMSRTLSYLPYIKDGSKKIFESHFGRHVRKNMLDEVNSGLIKRIVYQIRAIQEEKNLKKVDCFVVLTEQDAKNWGKMSNLKVIPNPLSFYHEYTNNSSNHQVISVGRIEYQKGYDRLTDIWKLVNRRFPDWKMIVIGEGKNLAYIQKQITNAKLDHVIIIKPPTHEIVKELINSSIYLMTSRYEGFPMILIEAMACGLPVVSFDCPCGPSEIISEYEDGFLINNNDIESMVSKLYLLMENEELRRKMSLAAYKNIKRYSKEEIMRKWMALFNELLILGK